MASGRALPFYVPRGRGEPTRRLSITRYFLFPAARATNMAMKASLITYCMDLDILDRIGDEHLRTSTYWTSGRWDTLSEILGA